MPVRKIFQAKVMKREGCEEEVSKTKDAKKDGRGIGDRKTDKKKGMRRERDAKHKK